MDDGGGWSGRRVVVAGAAGRLGVAVAADLVALGAEVHAVDDADPDLAGLASVTRCDRRDPVAVEDALGRIGAVIDAVVHVGVVVPAGEVARDPADDAVLAFDAVRHLAARARTRMTVGGVVAAAVSAPGAPGAIAVRALEHWLVEAAPEYARGGVRLVALAVELGSMSDPAAVEAHARSLLRVAAPDARTLTGVVIPSGPVVRPPAPAPGPFDRGSFDTDRSGQGR